MTMPAGFVKLISHARGARSAIVSASSSIAGIVRSAKQMPPGPVVSWPSTPSPSGTDSSTTRPSRRPTRIAQNTKSAPSTASPRSVVTRNGSASAVLGGEPVQHAAHALEAAGVDVVQDDLVERQPVAPREQRAVDERDAEAAAADDRELHGAAIALT